MDFIKDLEKNELEVLIKQILKPDKDEDVENKIDKEFEEDVLDSFTNSAKKFNELSEEDYILFSQDNILPESYKLNVNYGDNVFEGYYERAMDEIRKQKVNSYSMVSRDIETQNLKNAMIVIKDKKENNVDTFLFDADKKASVDAYKWANVVWWHILYDLADKFIF